MKINDAVLDYREGSSLMKNAPERGLRIDSWAATSGTMELGMPQINSESKKRRKKQKGSHPALETSCRDCDPPEGTSLLNLSSPEIDQSLQPLVKSCLKLERETAQSCAEVTCSQVNIERKKPNERQSGSEINVIDCDIQESGTNVKNFEKDENSVLEVSEMNSSDLKDTFVVIKEQIGCSKRANTSLIEKCDHDLENKHVSLDQRNVKTYTRRKRGRTDSGGNGKRKVNTYRRRKRGGTNSRINGKSSASFQNASEEGLRDPLCHCSDDVPTARLREKKVDRALLGEHGTSVEVMEHMLTEEASLCLPDGEPASGDCKEKIKIKNLEKNSCEFSSASDVSVAGIPNELLEQNNVAKHHKIQITGGEVFRGNEDFDEPASCGEGETSKSGCDSSCKHLEQMDVEIETKMDGIPSPHSGFVKNDADLDVVIAEQNVSQISNSPPERALMDSNKKKLLILDVNGLLVDIVPYVPYGYKVDIMISGKAVFKRPFCDDFLQFCFDRFVVGVWSSRTKRNMDRLIDFLMEDSRDKLLFCWDQSHCTSTGFTTIENKEKPLVLKELRRLWEKLEPNLSFEKGEYSEANTLLLDDSPYKALRNPVNTAIFPHTYRYREVNDTSLGPGGDLRVYLEGLAMAEDVPRYVKENPFGQRAITEANPSWGFYRKIIEANAHPHQDDANTSFVCQ